MTSLKLTATFWLYLIALCLMSCGGSGPASQASFQLTSLNGEPRTPVWVGFKDGNGDWVQSSAPTSDGKYIETVTDPNGRYGFAVLTMQPNGRRYFSYYFSTLAESEEMHDTDFHVSETETQVTGTVRNTSGLGWRVNVGENSTDGEGDGSYNIASIPGRYDIGATRRDGRVWLRRNVEVPNVVGQDIDFNDPLYSGELSEREITFNNGSPDLVLSIIKTQSGEVFAGYSDPQATPVTGAILPDNLAHAGDTNCLIAEQAFVLRSQCDPSRSHAVLDMRNISPFKSSLSGRTVTWVPYFSAQEYVFVIVPGSREGLITVVVTQGYAKGNLLLDDLSSMVGENLSLSGGGRDIFMGFAHWSNRSEKELRRLSRGVFFPVLEDGVSYTQVQTEFR